MEYLLGFMACLCLVLLYDKFKPKKAFDKVEEEQEDKVKEHYNKMLNYDIRQAYGGKK